MPESSIHQSDAELYRDLFTAFITTRRCCSNPLAYGNRVGGDWPSWVPDLENSDTGWLGSVAARWNLGQQINSPSLHVDGRQLTVPAMFEGKITYVGGRFYEIPEPTEGVALESHQHAEAITEI